jgi:hypothetical protein
LLFYSVAGGDVAASFVADHAWADWAVWGAAVVV